LIQQHQRERAYSVLQARMREVVECAKGLVAEYMALERRSAAGHSSVVRKVDRVLNILEVSEEKVDFIKERLSLLTSRADQTPLEGGRGFAEGQLSFAGAVKAGGVRRVMLEPIDASVINAGSECRDFIKEKVDPEELGWKVVGMRRRGQERVVLETTSAAEVQRILDDDRLKERGLKASKIITRKPRIIFYNVPREIVDGERFYGCLCEQNEMKDWHDRLKEEMSMLFMRGNREHQNVNVVFEVSPGLRKHLLSKGRVFLKWSSCRVTDFIEISRCFRCQAFGHVAKFCKAPKEVCRRCGEEGHKMNVCQGPLSCRLCKKGGRKADHVIGDGISCEARKRLLEEIMAQTQYE